MVAIILYGPDAPPVAIVTNLLCTLTGVSAAVVGLLLEAVETVAVFLSSQAESESANNVVAAMLSVNFIFSYVAPVLLGEASEMMSLQFMIFHVQTFAFIMLLLSCKEIVKEHIPLALNKNPKTPHFLACPNVLCSVDQSRHGFLKSGHWHVLSVARYP